MRLEHRAAMMPVPARWSVERAAMAALGSELYGFASRSAASAASMNIAAMARQSAGVAEKALVLPFGAVRLSTNEKLGNCRLNDS
jgi:hypothetical protein